MSGEMAEKYPLLAQALANGDAITLTLDDDDAPTYHLNNELFDDDNWARDRDVVPLYREFIQADANGDVVWEYEWTKSWGSKQKAVGLTAAAKAKEDGAG